MALYGMFKKVPNQQYKYIPRYWDPEKEAREERIRLLKGQSSDDVDSIKGRVSRGLKRGRHTGQSKALFKTNLLLLGVIIALVAVSYYILVVYMPDIVASIEGGSK